ncbi:MAG: hypothetical protein KF841_10830 [Phycisphaerae bacterium]|nr:hypothetical protein [Phycisphaerae bacterium]
MAKKNSSGRAAGAAHGGGSVWGHLVVSVCACLLTVSIAGSAIFLVWRVIDRSELRSKVEMFVASLENRTPAELAERAASLKAHPKVARYVLPEIARTIRLAKSEGRQRAAIEISRAFLTDESIVKTLFDLRLDDRETIAAAAIDVLSELQPPARAVDLIGQCLTDSKTAGGVDAACAALYGLGEAGRVEMGKRIGRLSEGRRMWLVNYCAATPSTEQGAWLDMLQADGAESVRSAAAAARLES